MTSKNPRKAASSMRTGSAMNNREAASVAASVGQQDARRRAISVWPEWSDADVNAEKWEVAHRGGKKEEKGKSPVVQHFFDDPEGKIDLPSQFKVFTWKRPQDFITDKTPMIVEDEGKFDLMSSNEYVHNSELLRWVTSQVEALWRQSEVTPGAGPPGSDPAPPGDGAEPEHSWHPWEHIYAINKVAKGPNVPVYNPHGKYVVRLYWMGSWRKMIIDDTMPFDEEDRMLLPSSTLTHELWPMLLTKALLKIANLDLSGGSSSCEFGDFSVVHSLTGWLPEVIPLTPGHLPEVWTLLKAALPEFTLPPAPQEPPEGEAGEGKDGAPGDGSKDEKSEKDKEKSGSDKSDVKSTKDGKEKGKDKKDDKKDKKDKDKDKDKGKEKSMIQEEAPLPEHPELMVFASYSGPPKYPVRVSVLREMANASECLRRTGLSHQYPHPVLVTQSRACPLTPPPPQENVPAWKLIRPRKKRSCPADDALDAEDDRPIQSLKITSPFLNYNVSPVPIPTDTHRPDSALRRGGSRVSSRPGTANADSITEGDEDRPEEPASPPTQPTTPTPATPTPPATTENVTGDSDKDPAKPTTPVKDAKKTALKSASRTKVDAQTSDPTKAPTGTKQGAAKPGVKRAGSAAGRGADKEGSKDGQRKDSKTEVTGSSKDKQAPQPAADPAVDPSAVPGPPSAPEDCPECPAPQDGTDTTETPVVNADHVWMDFDHFCQCFKSLYIFHKTNTYPHNYKHTDMKTATEDRQPSFLFVDSLEPTTVTVSFSAISRWNEPLPTPPKEESKTGLKSSKDKMGDRDSKAEAMTVDTSSVVDGGDVAGVPGTEVLQPGLLVAETYSWKSLLAGQQLLRLRTTGVHATVLCLPAGRHLIKFSMSAPYGYHLHLSSSYSFVFGDEEKVMEQLTKESCRFLDNAVQVMTHLGKCMTAFSDPVTFQPSYDAYVTSHCPYRQDRRVSNKHHDKVYNEALYDMLRKVLPDPTPEMAFAWRAFNYDCTSKNILKLSHGSNSRPATGVTSSDRGSAGGKKGNKKKETTDNKADHVWKNREATPEELVAIVKLQKCWRGAFVRKIKDARTPGTEMNQKTADTLTRAWSSLEPALDNHGLLVFRAMFRADPALMVHYPFYKDEWNKISFCDYQGTYPDLAPNSWFVLFREIFHVSDEMMCVPKLYTTFPSCTLRVINNDTGKELPRVFHKVAPAQYKKNKTGYTFVSEAHTPDLPTPSGKWRLRVIGALPGLPAPARGTEINSSFVTKELRDYYLPNDNNVILRHSVRVQEDQQLSLQLAVSRSDVFVRLCVLDHDVEVAAAEGKGQVVLPAVTFFKEPGDGDEVKRSNSRSSMKGKGSRDNLNKASKRVSSGRSTRSSSSRHSITSLDEDMEKSHKYMVQAQVLHQSWPLSESQWTFVGMLKELEKNDMKLSHKEGPTSPQRNEKQSATATKSTSKDKGGKGKAKDKDKSSRPPSQQFDASKPNWSLRVVADSAYVDDLEMKKDTERVDEVGAMKKAWEDADPGRAAKATQSRLQYLNNHVIQTRPDEDDAEPPVDAEVGGPVTSEGAVSPVPTLGLDALDSDTVLTLRPPAPPPAPRDVLPLIDLTPFLRNTDVPPRLQDEAELAAELTTRQAEISAYREHRAAVDEHREHERAARNHAKIHQLSTFEHLQLTLDSARDAVNAPRQAFRERYLEAERRRLEELAAQEALLRADADKAPTPKGRKSAKGDKKTASAKKKK